MSVHVWIRTASPADIRTWLRSEDFIDLSDLPSTREVPLDRDWDAVHYLLTGSVEEGRGPIAFIKHGGQDEQQGGNDRLFHPRQVRRIDAALTALPMREVRRRFKPKLMAEDVYLGSWDHDPPHEGLLFDVIKELKALVKQAAKRGDWLVYSDDA